jgi:hypothetical protein
MSRVALIIKRFFGKNTLRKKYFILPSVLNHPEGLPRM